MGMVHTFSWKKDHDFFASCHMVNCISPEVLFSRVFSQFLDSILHTGHGNPDRVVKMQAQSQSQVSSKYDLKLITQFLFCGIFLGL